jgi:hypothetical protein
VLRGRPDRVTHPRAASLHRGVPGTRRRRPRGAVGLRGRRAAAGRGGTITTE